MKTHFNNRHTYGLGSGGEENARSGSYHVHLKRESVVVIPREAVERRETLTRASLPHTQHFRQKLPSLFAWRFADFVQHDVQILSTTVLGVVIRIWQELRFLFEAAALFHRLLDWWEPLRLDVKVPHIHRRADAVENPSSVDARSQRLLLDRAKVVVWAHFHNVTAFRRKNQVTVRSAVRAKYKRSILEHLSVLEPA